MKQITFDYFVDVLSSRFQRAWLFELQISYLPHVVRTPYPLVFHRGFERVSRLSVFGGTEIIISVFHLTLT